MIQRRSVLALPAVLFGLGQAFDLPMISSQSKCHPMTSTVSRREILHQAAWISCTIVLTKSPDVSVAADSFSANLKQIKEARQQLDPVPDLIKAEKWDSVRAILITQPLSDCWTKTARPLLTNYAESLGDVGGDELEALETKEDLNSHLRYLDMAVYNNVFNPIKTMGETGATKQLIKSYYEDPINEWKASVAAFDKLIKLAGGLS